MSNSRDAIIKRATEAAIQKLKAQMPKPTREEIVDAVFNDTRDQIALENAGNGKDARLPNISCLVPYQIARCITEFELVKCIRYTQEATELEREPIGVYQEDGPDEGIYATDALSLKRLVRKYNYTISKFDLEDVENILRAELPHVARTTDRDLICVNNGVVNYRTKELLPFSPDMVFTSKCRVDYDPMARNVVIHNDEDGTDWDVESWMEGLSKDPEVVNVLWQILGAIIRPNVAWNKSAWFYATSGNNGKGTLCALMRNLCGEGTHASIKLSDFSKDFILEPLLHASAIIVDENDVGLFIDKVANLKAVITNDVIQINRKFKAPIDFQFKGFMVQCLNEFPRIKDKSNSLYRRQLIIEFTECFTGHERRYIKDDYLKRPEVLRYVLKRVVTMPDYYALTEPASCKNVLESYKSFNDPVRLFCEEVMSQCVWDLLPYDFLYDLYRAWFKKANPSGSVQGKNTFMEDIRQYVTNNNTGWAYPTKGPDGKERKVRSAGKGMDRPEPLIVEYDLKDWMNKDYVGSNPTRLSITTPKVNYRGLVRLSAADSIDEGGEDDA